MTEMRQQHDRKLPGWLARIGGGRGHPRDIAAGWLISVVLHMLMLAVFVGVTWSSGNLPRGDGRERQVNVVLPGKSAAIDAGAAGRMDLAAPAGKLEVPRLKGATQVDPIREVGTASEAPSKIERIISIDVAGGSEMPSAMKGDWASFAAGGGGGGTGGASFFGLQAGGRKFVFVVDRSGSMKGAKLEAAKAELIRSVGALKRGAKFFTVFFNGSHEAMPAKDLVRASEANKRKHFAWVRGIDAEGYTNPTSAMRLALSLNPDAIWLLSDGIFDASAAEEIRRANPARKVQVHTIAFYSREGEKVLQQIAEDNRGRYRFVSPESIGLGRRR